MWSQARARLPRRRVCCCLDGSRRRERTIWVSPVPGLRRDERVLENEGQRTKSGGEAMEMMEMLRVRGKRVNSRCTLATQSWHEYRKTYKRAQTPLEMASLVEHSQMTEYLSRRRYVTVSTGVAFKLISIRVHTISSTCMYRLSYPFLKENETYVRKVP